MTVFADAMARMFGDPNMGRDATYIPGAGPQAGVRVIVARPDTVAGFSDASLSSATLRLEVRVAEVSAPRPGDVFDLAGERFVIQGEPQRDAQRLVWEIDTRPE